MRTTLPSFRPFLFLSIVLALLLMPRMQGVAYAVPCGGAASPTCDGDCAPGTQCVDIGYPGPPAGTCGCVPAPDACGAVEGPPLCYGECPPGESCFDKGSPIGCECDVVPTLSEWGIFGMSLAMLGMVLYRRRELERG